MKRTIRLILASASPRRSELLTRMGYTFEIIPARTDELQDDGKISAEKLAAENARLKAQAVAEIYPDACVIGADTVVESGGMIFGKPAGEEDAVRMLRMLSGHEHRVITGVAVYFAHDPEVFTEISTVTFKSLTDSDIHAYMKAVQVMDKAGAYAIQEHDEMIIAKYEGSLDNIIGLPTERLQSVLAKIYFVNG